MNETCGKVNINALENATYQYIDCDNVIRQERQKLSTGIRDPNKEESGGNENLGETCLIMTLEPL